MPYDCITCGLLPQDWHDGRDETECFDACIPAGECKRPNDPAVTRLNGRCYWYGENGETNGWGLPDPGHEKRTKDDPPRHQKPLPGQYRV